MLVCEQLVIVGLQPQRVVVPAGVRQPQLAPERAFVQGMGRITVLVRGGDVVLAQGVDVIRAVLEHRLVVRRADGVRGRSLQVQAGK